MSDSEPEHDTIDLDALETAEHLNANATIEEARDAFVNHLEKSNKSDRTVQTYRSTFDRFCRWLDGKREPKNITHNVIEIYLGDLKDRNLKWKTRSQYYYAIKQFIEFFDRETEAWSNGNGNGNGNGDGNPIDNMDTALIPRGKKSEKKRTNKNIPYVTAEQKERLCENVDGLKLRNEFIIKLFFQTGIREGELRRIKLDDIDRNKRTINIDEQKNNEYRTVYYQSSLDFYVNQWIDVDRKALTTSNSPYLFPTHQSERIQMGRPNKIIKDAAENADIQEVLYIDAADRERYAITAHSLRHGHAMMSLKKGIDVRTIQEHLGHKNIEQTMEYLKVLDEDVRDAYRRKGPGQDNDRQAEQRFEEQDRAR